MRVFVTSLFGLLLGGSALAQTPVCDTANPCKTIRIANNTNGPIWAIIFTGPKDPHDDWLMAQFKVAPGSPVTYQNSKNNTIYVPDVNGSLDKKGIPKNEYVEVTVPFYSQLATCNPNSTCADTYSDWWNGGRVMIYDNLAEMEANYATDLPSRVSSPMSPGPCIKISTNNVLGPCQSPALLRPAADPLNTNHMQLHEYTFGSANPAPPPTNTTVQFVTNNQLVNYNISSVDSVYLPTAMEPFGNPLIRYIGSVIDPTDFSTVLKNFVTKNPPDGFTGWPTYAAQNNIPVNPNRPRVPGAYNVFANEWSGLFPDPQTGKYINNGVLTPSCNPDSTQCPPVDRMIKLYRRCRAASSPPPADICNAYQAVLTLFDKNFQDYKQLACANPKVTNDEITVLKHLYGWVPWNEFCLSSDNALKNSLGEVKFNELLQKYIHDLQYAYRNPAITSADKSDFNPFVQLIHGCGTVIPPACTTPPFLNEFAYSFSVDDVFAVQIYVGDGVIITVAGKKGLDNRDLIDMSKQVTVDLTTLHPGIAEWNQVGLCSTTANFATVNPDGPFYKFWPQTDNSQGKGYPCTITATDFKNKTYQFILDPGPDGSVNPTMKIVCTGVPNLKWCQGDPIGVGGVKIVLNGDTPALPNQANTPLIDPDPPTSSHDTSGDGVSDILWRHTGDTLRVWLMKNAQLFQSGDTGIVDKSWLIVGQRDFDNDGKADLLWRHTSGALAIWLMNGTSIINQPPVSPYAVGNVDPSWTVVGTGDCNGAKEPGLGCILWRHNSGDIGVWRMDARRNPKDTPILQTGGLGNPGGTWSVAGVADFNGDHNADVLWRDNSGNVAIWFMNGVELLSPPVVVGNPGADWTIVGTGDFNGDGKFDILWRHTSGAKGIWLMNGSAILSAAGIGNPGADWSVEVTGDFNYDGKSDILWRHTSGAVAIWLMNGTALLSAPVSLGLMDLSWKIQRDNAD